MRLKNLNKIIYLFIFLFLNLGDLSAEETVDIWKKNKNINNDVQPTNQKEQLNKIGQNLIDTKPINKDLKITESSDDLEPEKILFGTIDPEINNFKLSMWTNSNGKDIKDIFKRIDKIELSKTAEEFFINIMMTYSFAPSQNMTEEEFLDLKISWLIKNDKVKLLEEFLDKNKEFKSKKKVIQYLVDKNIAKANLSEGCKKSEFISKEIKDSYLEKFKIYCLIFDNKKNEAQLVYDILKEQKLSNKFFDSKINFLLGINETADNKIDDSNLLNFYLSSVTVPDFNYEPNNKTNKFIWEYLNAANLLGIKDFEDNEKIKNLEIAANDNTVDKLKIFDIYKKIPFDLNTLINAEGVYKSLDGVNSRALIFQKYLLSDNVENKIIYLDLLKNLFKKDNISNIFTKFMSDELKKLMSNDIPDSYIEMVKSNILTEEEYELGRIKYDDKVLHRSRVMRFYTEVETPFEKSQKDLNNVYKKIKRNKNYFYSGKDLALIESLKIDGFLIPKEIKYAEISKNYTVPDTLINLVKNEEIGRLALKFVEIIGEDEVYELDAETIYFMTNILNKANLIKFRNKVLSTALPLRM
jgi:hypothetical protein